MMRSCGEAKPGQDGGLIRAPETVIAGIGFIHGLVGAGGAAIDRVNCGDSRSIQGRGPVEHEDLRA